MGCPRLSAPLLTQMANASESQAGAAPLPTPDTIRSWGVKEVSKWAMLIDGIDAEDAAILVKNKIKGADLLERVTEEKLVLLCKMAVGPAGRIMSALAAIKSVEAAVPASMGESTGASRGFMSAVLSEGTIMAT